MNILPHVTLPAASPALRGEAAKIRPFVRVSYATARERTPPVVFFADTVFMPRPGPPKPVRRVDAEFLISLWPLIRRKATERGLVLQPFKLQL